MKVTSKVMEDGRVILCINENDGTPITTKELEPKTFAAVVGEWAGQLLKDNEQMITLEGEDVEFYLIRRSKKMKPKKEK